MVVDHSEFRRMEDKVEETEANALVEHDARSSSITVKSSVANAESGLNCDLYPTFQAPHITPAPQRRDSCQKRPRCAVF